MRSSARPSPGIGEGTPPSAVFARTIRWRGDFFACAFPVPLGGRDGTGGPSDPRAAGRANGQVRFLARGVAKPVLHETASRAAEGKKTFRLFAGNANPGFRGGGCGVRGRRLTGSCRNSWGRAPSLPQNFNRAGTGTGLFP